MIRFVSPPVFSSDSIYDVLARHVGTAPEPPSAALGRAVSPDLEAIILRCLAKDPAERFPSAEELERELRVMAKGLS